MSSPVKIGQCDCCRIEDVEVREYPVHSMTPAHALGQRQKNLCYLCADSFVGTTVDYLPRDADKHDMLSHVCRVAHMVVRQLGQEIRFPRNKIPSIDKEEEDNE